MSQVPKSIEVLVDLERHQSLALAIYGGNSIGPGLQIIKSGKGQLVLIHNGHMYTFCDQRDNKGLWICVKKKTLNCKGCLTTMHGQLVSSIGHNHIQIHDVIQRLQVSRQQHAAGEIM